MKEYTLFFEFVNKYNHNVKVPIITTNLKNMDKFTGNFGNFKDLFDNLPKDIKKFITNEVSDLNSINEEKLLKKHFKLDEDAFILLKDNIDVIYITPSELTKLIVNQRMTFDELSQSILKSRTTLNIKRRYNFFEYLYNEYVKNNKIIGMMDTYDISEKMPMLKNDKLMIAAIATDKDNLVLLSKKIGQTSTGRRNLAFKFKELYYDIEKALLLDSDLINSRKEKSEDILLLNDALSTFKDFKKDYEKEYKLTYTV